MVRTGLFDRVKLAVVIVLVLTLTALTTGLADTWWDTSFPDRATVSVENPSPFDRHDSLTTLNGSELEDEAGIDLSQLQPSEDAFRVTGPLWLEDFEQDNPFREINPDVFLREDGGDQFLRIIDGGNAIRHLHYPFNTSANYSFSALVEGNGRAGLVPGVLESHVGYWHFEEGSGQWANDSTSNDNNGKLGGALSSESDDPLWVEGRFGKALRFDGSDDRVGVADSERLEPGSAITVSAWFKSRVNRTEEATGWYGGITKGNSWLFGWHGWSDGWAFGVYDEDGTWDGAGNVGDYYIEAGTWYHVVGTFQNATARIYVNGNLEGSRTYSTARTVPDTDNNIIIGDRDQVWNGSIDEVMILDEELNETEVRNLYWMYTADVSHSSTSGFTATSNEFTAPFNNASLLLSTGSSASFDDLSIRPENREVPSRVNDWTSTQNNRSLDDSNDFFDANDELSWLVDEQWANSELQYRVYWNDTASKKTYADSRTSEWGVRDSLHNDSYAYLEDGSSRFPYVGYWSFENDDWQDDPSKARNVNDSSGEMNHGVFNGQNDGTLTNGPNWVNGIHDKALEFDGSDDHVDMGDTLNGSNAFTVSAWYTTPGTGDNSYQMVQAKLDGPFASTPGYGLQLQGGEEPNFALSDGTDVVNTRSGVTPTDQWVHFVGIKDGNNARIYVNGELENTTDISAIDSPANTASFTIGRDESPGGHFEGKIDDVRLYRTGLSASQINRLYQGTRVTDGLVGEWTFDEGEGDTAHDTSMWRSGKEGQGLSFDGMDDFVKAEDDPNLDTGETTVLAWMRYRSSASRNPIVEHLQGCKDNGYLFSLDTGRRKLALHTGSGGTSLDQFYSDVTVAPDVWHEVGFIWDTYNATHSIQKIIVNGEISNTSLYNVDVPSSIPSDFRIGGTGDCFAGNDAFFNGSIDEVRVFDRALSASEIRNQHALELSNNFLSTSFNPVTGIEVTNASSSERFSYRFSEVLLDGRNILDQYPGYLRKIEWFNPVSETWEEWRKDSRPDWTDPAFKQSFKWRYRFNDEDSPDVSLIYQMTAGDPFIRTRVTADSEGTGDHTLTIPVKQSGRKDVLIPAEENQDWWDTSWNYRKPVTVEENSGSQLTDYQVAVDPNIYPNDNLVGSWHFSEGEGTLAHDYSGENNHGELENGPQWVKGRVGSALSFDGNDFVNVSQDTSLDVGSEVTVGAWVRLAEDTANMNTILSNADGSKGLGGYRLEIGETESNHPEFELSLGSWTQLVADRELEPGTFYQVVGTYDGSEMRIYVNGELDASKGVSGSIVAPNTETRIGANRYSTLQSFFNGTIDEVLVYDRALSESEIDQLYTASKARLDYGDVRFTDADNNELGYFHQYDDTFWVKVPEISANSEKQLYMYHGNEDASDASDGHATFDFFDDFSDGLDASWVKNESKGTVTEEGGKIKVEATGSDNGAMVAGIKTASYLFTQGHAIEAVSKSTSGRHNGGVIVSEDNPISVHNSQQTNPSLQYYLRPDGDDYIADSYDSSRCASGSLSWDPEKWANYRIEFYSDSLSKFYRQDSLDYTVTNTNCNPAGHTLHVAFGIDGHTTPGTTFYDQVFVRNVVKKYPNVSTGSQEELAEPYSRVSAQNSFKDGSLFNVDADGLFSDLTIGLPDGHDDALVGHWRLDGTTGKVIDSSGNTNNGVVKNGVTRGVDGVRNTTAFDFERNDEHIRAEDSSSLDSITGEITVSAWVKYANDGKSQDDPIVVKSNDVQFGTGWALWYGWGKDLRFTVAGDHHVIDDTSWIEPRKWQHLVGVYDGEDIKIYGDGKLRGVEDGPDNGVPNNDDPLFIGHSARSNAYFNGSIDEARVYSRALTASEVKNLYQPSLSRFTSSFLDYGANTPWERVSWEGREEANTEIQARVQTAGSLQRVDSSSDWDGGSGNARWQFKRPITVEEIAGQDLDTPVAKFYMDTKQLIDEGKMQSDCDDIRFWSSREGLLNYTVEGGCNTDRTEIYVQLSSIGQNEERTISMYYGNPSAANDEWESLDEWVIAHGDDQDLKYYTSNQDSTFSSGTTFGGSYVGEDDGGIVGAQFAGDERWDLISHDEVNNEWDLWQDIGNSPPSSPTCTVFSGSYSQKAQGLDAGDIDGDGDMDMASATHEIWLENTNSCSWTENSINLDIYRDVELEDFNADGCVDIVYTHPSNTNVEFAPGNCDGTFGSNSSIYDGASGNDKWLGGGDFNEDGHYDVIINDQDNSEVYIYAGNGDGTFSNINTINDEGYDHLNTAVWDLNKDGHDDFIGGEHGEDDVHYFEGNGDGTFTKDPNGKVDNYNGPLGVAIFEEYSDVLNVEIGNAERSLDSLRTFSAGSYLSSWKDRGQNSGYTVHPVARWQFSEGAGQFANDSIGSNDGTLGGSASSGTDDPTWQQDCRENGCMEFDGSDDVVDVVDELAFDRRSFVVSAWLKPFANPPNSQHFFSATTAHSFREAIVGRYYDDGRIRFGFYSDDLDAPAGTALFGEWQHIAMIYNNDTDTSQIFLNGELVAEGSNGPFEGTNPDIKVGSWEGSASWDGQIDDVRVYDQALSKEEVRDAMTGPGKDYIQWDSTGGQDLKPISQWRIDAGRGQIAYDAVGSEDGSLNGGPQWVEDCRYQGCLEFDGSDDWVDIGTVLDNRQQFSFTSWVKTPMSSGDRDAVINGHGQFLIAFRNAAGEEDLSWLIGNVDSWDVTKRISRPVAGKWHFLAATWDGSTFEGYINGERKFSEPTTISSTGVAPETDKIGTAARTSNGYRYLGKIDDARLYNRSLSHSEIRALYNAPSQSWKTSSQQVRTTDFDFTAEKNLVGAWSFEGVGQSVTDWSGWDNHGTLGDNASSFGEDPVRASGKSGQGMSFDGNDDFVDTGDPIVGNHDFTLMAWTTVSELTGSHRRIMANHENSGTNSGVFLGVRNTDDWQFGLRLSDGSDARVDSGKTPKTNQWIHVAGIWDGSQLELFIDGVSVGTASAGSHNPSPVNMHIGNSGGLSEPWNGSIDEVYIFNRTLSETEIEQLMGTSDFTSELDAEKGEFFSAGEGEFLQFKSNLVTGTSASIPRLQHVTTSQDTSGWTPWTNESAGSDIFVPGNQYASVQVNLSSSVAENSPALELVTLHNAKGGIIRIGDNKSYGPNLNSQTRPWTTLSSNTSSDYPSFLGTSFKGRPLTVEDKDLSYKFSFGSDDSAYKQINLGTQGEVDTAKNANNGSTPDFTENDKSAFEWSNESLLDVASSSLSSYFTTNQGEFLNNTWQYTSSKDLVGYWSFDNVLGTTVSDSSGQGNSGTFHGLNDDLTGIFHGMELNGTFHGMKNNGTLGTGSGSDSNDPIWKDNCKLRGCLEFDGSDDFVRTSNFSTGDQITVTLWAKSDVVPTNDQRMVFNGNDAGAVSFFVDDGSQSATPRSNWFAWVYDSGAYGKVSSGANITADTWYHVAYVYDYTNNNAELYVNGDSVDTNTAGTDPSHTSRRYIGQHPSGADQWDGQIDDVRVFDRALTSSEIDSVMDGEVIGDGLVGRYTFDEGSGQKAYNTDFLAQGKRGDALEFDGTDDYVDVSGSALPATQEVTVSLWLKSRGEPRQSSIFEANNATGDRVLNAHVPWQNGVIFWDFGGCCDKGRISKELPQRFYTGWHHYTFIANNNTQKMAIYIDGELFHEEGHARGLSSAADDFSIGAYVEGNHNKDGVIDDFRIYTRELSKQEIREQMAGAPPSEGIVGYWSGDSVGGRTVFNDQWRRGGKTGGGIKFDGSDDYVAADDVAEEVSENISVTAWYKPQASDRAVAAFNQDGGGNRLLLYSNAFFTPDIDANLQYNTEITNGEWHHLAAVLDTDNDQITIFINGKEDRQDTTTVEIDSTDLFSIGQEWDSSSTSAHFNGSMDTIRVYDQVLSRSQIKQEMSGPPADSVVANYQMDKSWGRDVISSEWWQEGKFDGSVEFGEEDHYVEIDNVLDDKTTYTVSAWAKPEVTDKRQTIFSERQSSTVTPIRAVLQANDDNEVRFIVRDDDGTLVIANGDRYQAGEWMHLVGVRNGDTVKVFKNGDLVETESGELGAITVNDQATFIGRQHTDSAGWIHAFNGTIDDVRVYKSAFSKDKVKQLYKTSPSLFTDQFGVGTDRSFTSAEKGVDGDVIENYPEGAWNFNRLAGPTLPDSTVNEHDGEFIGGHNGTFNGDPQWVDGKFGKALKFDGSDDTVKVSDSSTLDIREAITISAWVKPGSYPDEYSVIVGKTGGSSGYRLEIGDQNTADTADDRFLFLIRNSSATDSVPSDTATFSYNSGWRHVTGVYDGSDLKIYVDGVLENTVSTGMGSVPTNNLCLRIGDLSCNWASGTRPFNGTIDTVRIYNRSLTASQIDSLFNNERVTDGLVAEWLFDEGYGNKIADSSRIRDGRFGQGLDLEKQRYVEVGDTKELGMYNSSFTAMAWIKLREFISPDSGVFGTDGGSPMHLVIRGNSPYMGFWANDMSTTKDLELNRWYHITYRHNDSADQHTIYVDGKHIRSEGDHPPFTRDDPVVIAGYGGSARLNGSIDEPRIYGSALTQQQIQEVVNKPIADTIVRQQATRQLDNQTFYVLQDGENKDVAGEGRTGGSVEYANPGVWEQAVDAVEQFADVLVSTSPEQPLVGSGAGSGDEFTVTGDTQNSQNLIVNITIEDPDDSDGAEQTCTQRLTSTSGQVTCTYRATINDQTGDWTANVSAMYHDGILTSQTKTFQVSTISNVTIKIRYTLPGSTEYIDGEQRSQGIYTDDDIDYAYLTSELLAPETLFGLVNFGEFLQLGWEKVGGEVRVNMTQGFDQSAGQQGAFLIPFTEGTHLDIERREGNVQGGFFSSADFLSFPGPNFAYELIQKKVIRVTLEYVKDEIDLTGNAQEWGSGTHRLFPRNMGPNVNNTIQVEIE